MAKYAYFCTGLTGGTTGCLDKIDGAVLQDQDIALVVESTNFYVFLLDEDSGESESSPDVIAPDANAGDKRWISIQYYRSISIEKDDSVYVWKKVALSDSESEQTLTTESGELTLANLDSDQSLLPTFTEPVQITVGCAYQDRQAWISTEPTISTGNVTFGITLSSAGVEGTPYFDILVRQL